jgi:hypothetical protein
MRWALRSPDAVQRVPLNFRQRGAAESPTALAPPTPPRHLPWGERSDFLRVSILAWRFVTYDVLKKSGYFF